MAKIASYGLLLTPPLLWSSMLVVGSTVLEQVPPATLTFWTWLIAAVSLLPFTLPGFRNDLSIVAREWLPLFFFALLGVSGFQYLLYDGLLRAPVINAAILTPTIPIMVACLGTVFLGEKLRTVQVIGVLLSFAGACWIGAGGEWSNLSSLRLQEGEALILAANLLMAGYTIMLRLYPTKLSPLSFMAVIALIGTLQVLPFALSEVDLARSASLVLDHPVSLLYIGVVNYSLAYVFWNLAVKRHGATRTAIFLYLIPPFAAGLSVAFLQESLHLYHWVGVGLIGAGLYYSLHSRH